MRVWALSRLGHPLQRVRSVGILVVAITCLILSASRSASALPAFARKYGLRCSACHESWPMLNYFGQKFKDNGYQLMNDRDSPIWQNPSYWPIAMRITPFWSRESTNKVQADSTPGGGDAAADPGPFCGAALEFFRDDTLDKVDRINEILKKIHEERDDSSGDAGP